MRPPEADNTADQSSADRQVAGGQTELQLSAQSPRNLAHWVQAAAERKVKAWFSR